MNDHADAALDLVFGPVTRATLALFAGASGDHNQIHIDTDFARTHGRDDVIAHGMLTMGLFSRLVVEHFGATSLIQLETRFLAPTPVLATITCCGRLLESRRSGDTVLQKVELWAVIDDGVVTARGHAICTRREGIS